MHQRAASFPTQRQRPLYNLACAYALKGDTDRAIETLGQAVEAGFRNRSWIENDRDFDGVRKDERFQKILEKLSTKN